MKTYGSNGELYGKREKVKRGFTDWIPRSVRKKDYYLAAFVERYSDREYEIALFLAERALIDPSLPVVSYLSAVEAGVTAILANAYFQTGCMQIRFCGSSRGSLEEGYEVQIPRSIRRLADDIGVRFKQVDLISDSEGRELFFRMQRLPQKIVQQVFEGKLNHTHIAFLLTRNVWSYSSMVSIIENCPSPTRTLRGGWCPFTDWHRFMQDQLVLRWVVAEELLEALLRNVDCLDAEESDREIDTRWIDEMEVELTLSTPLDLPVWPAESGRLIHLTENRPFRAVLCPRDDLDYAFHFCFDANRGDRSKPTLLVVTKDFEWSGDECKLFAENLLTSDRRLAIVQLIDTLGDIDTAIRDRLKQCRSTARPLPMRGEG